MRYSVTVNQVIVASAKRSKSNDFWEPLVLSVATLYQENRDRITISGIKSRLIGIRIFELVINRLIRQEYIVDPTA